MTNLSIAPGLKLPMTLITETIGIISRRGAGKTHTAVTFAEELLKARIQVVVLDPLGVWWGLRSASDGSSKGFPVIVFGGDHGDVPLTENMGVHVADVIVSRNLSAVIDLSTLSKSAARRFATAFAERLYEAKQPEAKRTPLHLIIDEADLFIPQRIQPDQARMLGAFEAFPRRGRVRGFGVTVITQRPATLNKDVLTQIEVLITLQITGPQDRKAVQEWVDEHDDGHRDEFMKSLASLQRGEAWVWSPSLLKIFQRVHIRQRETFDSSRTPTAGARVSAPKALAPIDIEQLRTDMKVVLAQAMENDPERLKREIAELRKQLAAKGTDGISRAALGLAIDAAKDAMNAEWTQAEIKYLATIAADVAGVQLRIIETVETQAQALLAHIRDRVSNLSTHDKDLTKKREIRSNPALAAPYGASHGKITTYADIAAGIKRPPISGLGVTKLASGQRKILSVLALHRGKPMSNSKLALLAGYSGTSGTWASLLSALRNPEVGGEPYIEGGGANGIEITQTGVEALGPRDELPTGQALLDYWRSKIGGGMPRKIFDVLVEAYPESVGKSAIGEKIGASWQSGTFASALSKLNVMELIEGRGDLRQASTELMEAVNA